MWPRSLSRCGTSWAKTGNVFTGGARKWAVAVSVRKRWVVTVKNGSRSCWTKPVGLRDSIYARIKHNDAQGKWSCCPAIYGTAATEPINRVTWLRGHTSPFHLALHPLLMQYREPRKVTKFDTPTDCRQMPAALINNQCTSNPKSLHSFVFVKAVSSTEY